MSEGIVKWFNYKKGYGFIESSEFNHDIFLHHIEFINNDEYIHEGSTVTFEMMTGEKGFKAKNVRLKSKSD